LKKKVEMAGRKRANSLKTLLSKELLLTMAGERYFKRGEDYAGRGYVHDLTVESNGLTACVSGTEEYDVELLIEGKELLSTCTCPLGVDDIFCKHCVAVGLMWLANPIETKTRKISRSANKPVSIQEVESFLKQQDKSTLIKWMLERSQRDENWRQSLFLKVASQRSQGLDLTTFERALRNAINIRGFVEWKQVSNYAQGIDLVLNSIQEILEDYPQSVLKLCEYAIPLFEKALDSIDDSSGEVGGLMDEFEELHFDACELAKPDPAALAYYLLHSEMDSGFGGFHNAVETYALILGDVGLAHYRKLAESMWQEFPALSPKDAGDRNFKRRKLQRILEALAKNDGNIESVVAIKRQDLSNAYSYLEIAQLYLQDGQRDLALDWAESGLKAFEHSAALRDFTIEEYFHRGQIEDAMTLAWQSFTQSVTLQSYQKLKIQSERAKQWKTKRNEALDYVRQMLDSQSSKGTQALHSHKKISVPTLPAWNHSGMFVLDRSLLVEIFLWEGENDLAWQEAQAGGCSNRTWLQLAEQRQLSHREDALPIYMREIESLIKQTHNAAYADAITFLKKVRGLMITLHQQVEYNTFVAHLRKNYKAKRNFIALLDKRR
jgi:uncharacterized Zn finger protein